MNRRPQLSRRRQLGRVLPGHPRRPASHPFHCERSRNETRPAGPPPAGRKNSSERTTLARELGRRREGDLSPQQSRRLGHQAPGSVRFMTLGFPHYRRHRRSRASTSASSSNPLSCVNVAHRSAERKHPVVSAPFDSADGYRRCHPAPLMQLSLKPTRRPFLPWAALGRTGGGRLVHRLLSELIKTQVARRRAPLVKHPTERRR